jgi:hypothetical protein
MKLFKPNNTKINMKLLSNIDKGLMCLEQRNKHTYYRENPISLYRMLCELPISVLYELVYVEG